MKLEGLPVGHVLSEFKGPQKGQNYSGTDPAYVMVRVIGSGVVKVQENSTILMGNPSGDPARVGMIPMPNPANWADVGANIQASDGSVSRQLTAPDANPRWLRVVVVTAGTGNVSYGGRWGKIVS